MRTALVSLFFAAAFLACETRADHQPRTNAVELSQAPTTPSPNPTTPYNPAIPQPPPTGSPGTAGGSATPGGMGGGEFGTGGGAGGGSELPAPGAPDGGLTLRVHGAMASH